MIPVIPIVDKRSEEIYRTFEFASKFKWVNKVIVFDNIEQVIKLFEEAIIKPANKSYDLICKIKKNNKIGKIHISKYKKNK